MRTSREIYHWIRWDSRFDPAQFAFGYDDHGGEPKEVPLAAFVADGDIPWHRVLYLRRGTTIVCDRRTGLDRLAAADDRASVRWPSFATFARLAPKRFAHGAWRDEHELPLVAQAPLSILTFNVLDEQHVPDDLRDPRRFEALVESILRADASIVVLQEVTGAFARFMSDHEGIRRAYALSHELSADAAQSVLLLSKLPVRWAGSLRFSSQKSATLVGVEHAGGLLLVVGVHLPSDWARVARDTRRAYLRSLVAALDEARALPTVIAGDFNEGDDTHERPFDELNAFDHVWKLHGRGAGHTWQPARNLLAARASRSDRARRLDRVWLRCLDRSVSVLDARVRGPGHYEERELDAIDPESRRAVLAAVDARVLREVVERARAEHTFSTLVRRVKRWARAADRGSSVLLDGRTRVRGARGVVGDAGAERRRRRGVRAADREALGVERRERDRAAIGERVMGALGARRAPGAGAGEPRAQRDAIDDARDAHALSRRGRAGARAHREGRGRARVRPRRERDQALADGAGVRSRRERCGGRARAGSPRAGWSAR